MLLIVKPMSRWLLTTFVEWGGVDLPIACRLSVAAGCVPQGDALLQSRAVRLHIGVRGWRFPTRVTRRSEGVLLMVPAGAASERS